MATAIATPERVDSRLERSIWYMGGLMTFHADSNSTNGAFSLVEVHTLPGGEPPMHVHEREEELFYVLEGSLKVFRGSEELILGPGQSGFLPRGVPHTFRVQSNYVRMLTYITPGGFEEFFRQIGRPAEALMPEPNPAAPDFARIMRVAGEFGIRFII